MMNVLVIYFSQLTSIYKTTIFFVRINRLYLRTKLMMECFRAFLELISVDNKQLKPLQFRKANVSYEKDINHLMRGKE